jgi:carotenoid cleavage dioxygenase-like enzyme
MAAPAHFDRLFFADAVERSSPIGAIEGTIPSWLNGDYYTNGPARFERSGVRCNHWLDGDGFVHRLNFSSGRVSHTSRFVRTAKLVEEEQQRRFLYRAFGTGFPGDKLRRGLMLEPPVNVSVYPFGEKLLAFGEQTLPIELDPVTLETRGPFDFGGKLNEISPFTAHPKIDPATGAMTAFGIAFSARPTLYTYEIDADCTNFRRRRVRLDRNYSIHDCGVSENFVIVHLGPLILDLDRFIGGGQTLLDSLDWQPERGSRLLLVSRDPNAGDPIEIEVAPKYCLHQINAFEDSGALVVDILEIDEPIYPHYQPLEELFAHAPLARPVRYRIDLGAKKVIERIESGYERTPDFPSLRPSDTSKTYSGFWMLGMSQAGTSGRKFFDELVRIDWPTGSALDVYRTKPGIYLGGEPVCAEEHPGSKDAAIVVQELDVEACRAAYLVFDAKSLAQGPVARIPLPHWIHPSFHASFQLRAPS